MPRRATAVFVALFLATVVGSLAVAPTALADFPAPVAAGDSAANIDLNSAQREVLVRWVARSTGTLRALHLRIQADGSACRQSGSTGYGLGNGGSWLVTTHPVLADGRPDMDTTLATQEFRPCEATTAVADVRQGVVRLAMGIDVARGTEYATVIRNTDPSPAANYTSTNFLYTKTGILGANGRNERSALAPDAYYGLDPRELVGYSHDGGHSWALPGGPYGAPGGRSFLPTYLQEYAGGQIAGQPYYYAAAGSTADRTMLFANFHRPWTIRELGAYTRTAGSGTLTLTVDGHQVASATVSGAGMLRAAISPVTVSPGQTVRVTASGLTIQNIVADTAWGRLMGLHLASTPWKVEGEPNFSQAAPVYALPAPDGPEEASPPATPPPVADPPVATSPPVAPAVTPPATEPPATDPPVVTPPATDPPVATSPPVTPPATDPPVVTPPVVTPPVVTPPVVVPPVVTPPVLRPPVVFPPVVKPPVVTPPVVKPPVTPPRPRHHDRHRKPTPCRARKHRRPGAHRSKAPACPAASHRRSRPPHA